MGLLSVALNKIRTDGVAPTVATAVSDPQETIYVSETARAAMRLYCRHRLIRPRGITIDASHDRVRPEAHTLLMGRYENEIVDFIDRYVPRATDVVELGGGIGFVSSYLDRHVDGEQVVLEPNPAILPVLHRTRELNDGTFDIVDAAYDSSGADVELSVGEQFIKASTVRSQQRSTAVSGVSLRQLLETYDLEEFVLIVDIEGSEVDLIGSELEVILESCPFLVVEYHHFEDIDQAVRDAKSTLEASDLVALERRRDEKTEKVIYRNPRFGQ